MSPEARQRVIGLIVGAVTIVVTLILLALLERAESQVNVCVTAEQRDHLRAVMLKAIDQALENQVSHLFANWVSDPSGNPKRAQNGTNAAIKAHIQARAATLAWDPAQCTAGMQLQSAATKPWR